MIFGTCLENISPSTKKQRTKKRKGDCLRTAALCRLLVRKNVFFHGKRSKLFYRDHFLTTVRGWQAGARQTVEQGETSACTSRGRQQPAASQQRSHQQGYPRYYNYHRNPASNTCRGIIVLVLLVGVKSVEFERWRTHRASVYRARGFTRRRTMRKIAARRQPADRRTSYHHQESEGRQIRGAVRARQSFARLRVACRPELVLHKCHERWACTYIWSQQYKK